MPKSGVNGLLMGFEKQRVLIWHFLINLRAFNYWVIESLSY